MANFTNNEINQNWQIFDLFQNGGVVLFKRRDLLHETRIQLEEANYHVCEVDCSQYQVKELLLSKIVDALKIPTYPEVNLDGFNDFLRELDFKNCTGIILILMNFHSFYKRSNHKVAFHILDILAHHHRSHLLKGNRFLTIAQSDDPRLDQKIGLIGGYSPVWNSFEWMKNARGL